MKRIETFASGEIVIIGHLSGSLLLYGGIVGRLLLIDCSFSLYTVNLTGFSLLLYGGILGSLLKADSNFSICTVIMAGFLTESEVTPLCFGLSHSRLDTHFQMI